MSSYLSTATSSIDWNALNKLLGQYRGDLAANGAIMGSYAADTTSADGFTIDGIGEKRGQYSDWTGANGSPDNSNILQSDISGVDKTIQSLGAQASLTDDQKAEQKSLTGLRQQLDVLRMVAASKINETNGFTNSKNVNQNAVWNALNSTDPATLKALKEIGQPDYSTLQSDSASAQFMTKLKNQMTQDAQPAAAAQSSPTDANGYTPDQETQISNTQTAIGDLTNSTLGNLAAQQQATTQELTTQLQQNAATTQRLATEGAMGGDVSGASAAAGTAAMNNDTSGQQTVYTTLQNQQAASNSTLQNYLDQLGTDEQGLSQLQGDAQKNAATYATQNLMNTLQTEMQQGQLSASLDLGKVQNEMSAYQNALQTGESGAAHIKNILQLILGASAAAAGAVLTATGVGAAVGVPLIVGGISSGVLGGAGLAQGQ